MNVTQNHIDELNSSIHIHMEPSDYAPEVQEEIRNYAKKAQMPGFRKGKVPTSLVKKMVGVGVVVDVVTKKVSQELDAYIKENELDLLGEPLPTIKHDETYFDIDCKKDLEFEFEIGLAPKFDLKLELSEAVTQYKIVPSDEDIEAKIADVRERFGDMENPEEVAEEDIVFGVVEELNEAGEVVEGGFSKSIPVNPKRLNAPDLYNSLIGKKLEDTVDFSLDMFENGADDAKEILFFSEEELEAAQSKKLRFRIGRINRTILAELNEEVFRKVLGDDTEIKDEESFREHFAKELELENENKGKFRYRRDIKKALESQHEMNFPESFLKKFLIQSEENTTEENVDARYEETLDGLKWSLIVAKIQKEYADETNIEEGEIEEKIRETLGTGMSVNAADGMMDQYVNYVMGNEQLARQYLYQIIDDKVFGVIEGKVVSEIKEITASEFEALEKEA